MQEIIYVQLLSEGTVVYRPVPAVKISENTYRLRGETIYDPDDEEWEFLPKSIVHVEEKGIEGKKMLIAVKKK